MNLCSPLQRTSLVLLVLGFLLIPGLALANGGTLRLNNVPMGAYLVSAFTDPTPVQVDSLDVSVLAVMRSSGEVAQGLTITVSTRHLDGTAPGDVRAATQDQADDPRYYATKFGLGAEGTWEITVAVEGPEGSGEASFEIRARDRGIFGNPLFLSLLALLPLLGIAFMIFRQGKAEAT